MSQARVKPGDVLGGKYKVERVLGAGGMGVVVAARHVDLGQRVALKFMLKEAMADSSHVERFLREARAAVQLKSLHTARVLDVGRLGNGEPYMVMEYLEGRDLDDELRARGPLPPHVAVDYVLQASEALAEAHGLGLIHRDIKPKNLFLTTSVDGRPLVKVLDFGLAKTLGGHNDVSLTATNSVFGSPQYMSPEQMKSAKDVDARSDIWSLGVSLYELLTGRVPFDAEGVAEICAMVLKDPVPPPSLLVRGLPPDLEATILRCLEKDPTRRWQSVAELAAALQPYALDEGSARRILHVMQSAAKVEHATIPSVNAISSPNAHPHALTENAAPPRTMSAWDSGEKTKRTTSRLSPMQLVTVVAAMAVVALATFSVGIIKWRASRQATAATATSDPAPSAASPTTAELAPTGTVIGASTPEPTGTAPTLGAGAAPAPAPPAAITTAAATTATATAKPSPRPPTTRATTQPTAKPAPTTRPAPTATTKPPRKGMDDF